MKNLNEMKVAELKEIAKELKISNWWNLKKDVLIAKIEEVQNMTEEEKQAAADEKAKEDEALAIYQKHWRKYTKTFNPVEFMEKYRAGEIELDIEEEKPAEQPIEEVEEIEETITEEKPEIEEEKPAEQLTPKRGALIEWDGKAQNICAWGKELGISPNTLYGRLYKMNWSVEKAFTTPSKKRK